MYRGLSKSKGGYAPGGLEYEGKEKFSGSRRGASGVFSDQITWVLLLFCAMFIFFHLALDSPAASSLSPNEALRDAFPRDRFAPVAMGAVKKPWMPAEEPASDSEDVVVIDSGASKPVAAVTADRAGFHPRSPSTTAEEDFVSTPQKQQQDSNDTPAEGGLPLPHQAEKNSNAWDMLPPIGEPVQEEPPASQPPVPPPSRVSVVDEEEEGLVRAEQIRKASQRENVVVGRPGREDKSRMNPPNRPGSESLTAESGSGVSVSPKLSRHSDPSEEFAARRAEAERVRESPWGAERLQQSRETAASDAAKKEEEENPVTRMSSLAEAVQRERALMKEEKDIQSPGEEVKTASDRSSPRRTPSSSSSARLQEDSNLSADKDLASLFGRDDREEPEQPSAERGKPTSQEMADPSIDRQGSLSDRKRHRYNPFGEDDEVQDHNNFHLKTDMKDLAETPPVMQKRVTEPEQAQGRGGGKKYMEEDDRTGRVVKEKGEDSRGGQKKTSREVDDDLLSSLAGGFHPRKGGRGVGDSAEEGREDPMEYMRKAMGGGGRGSGPSKGGDGGTDPQELLNQILGKAAGRRGGSGGSGKEEQQNNPADFLKHLMGGAGGEQMKGGGPEEFFKQMMGGAGGDAGRVRSEGRTGEVRSEKPVEEEGVNLKDESGSKNGKRDPAELLQQLMGGGKGGGKGGNPADFLHQLMGGGGEMGRGGSQRGRSQEEKGGGEHDPADFLKQLMGGAGGGGGGSPLGVPRLEKGGHGMSEGGAARGGSNPEDMLKQLFGGGGSAGGLGGRGGFGGEDMFGGKNGGRGPLGFGGGDSQVGVSDHRDLGRASQRGVEESGQRTSRKSMGDDFGSGMDSRQDYRRQRSADAHGGIGERSSGSGGKMGGNSLGSGDGGWGGREDPFGLQRGGGQHGGYGRGGFADEGEDQWI
uniref:Uncharacterized protein n=1 Tax=Chromera velia CCMP2878 TaxID=1169474 RepID=A0A0G4I2P2_9ALVE|eukprot:Cvel_10421.t1-p1 / transcript=Cvel_10421.t1 / gene=Cvel_10421 / organism=Chromera_velia_CCMP2878 / gene_product=hypothetical protein / transcript_product=hypothetical protein / location=Cvel_scaffold628:29194-32146(+) / protein_length=922 / sequence_SO=supercontig / SO=protein_coding / is_pseudo=false